MSTPEQKLKIQLDTVDALIAEFDKIWEEQGGDELYLDTINEFKKRLRKEAGEVVVDDDSSTTEEDEE